MDKIKDIIIKIEDLKTNKDFDSAVKILEEAIAKYSDDYRLYEELADIYIYKWNITKAYKSAKFALDLNSESATWNYLMWFILLSKQKIDEAISFLEKSNTLMSNNAEVLRNLWWAHSLNWDFERWISILKRALVLSPWDELIIEDLAMAYITSGNIKDWNSLLKKIWKEELSLINNEV